MCSGKLTRNLPVVSSRVAIPLVTIFLPGLQRKKALEYCIESTHRQKESSISLQQLCSIIQHGHTVVFIAFQRQRNTTQSYFVIRNILAVFIPITHELFSTKKNLNMSCLQILSLIRKYSVKRIEPLNDVCHVFNVWEKKAWKNICYLQRHQAGLTS